MALIDELELLDLFVGDVLEIISNDCLYFLPGSVLEGLVFGELVQDDRRVVLLAVVSVPAKKKVLN